MKNIIKTLVVMLTSIALFQTANAGELTVTGTAKATYNITSGYASKGKGIGVANEFNLGANGELDNGMTWKYQVQMDPSDAASISGGGVDDSRIEITSGFGTLGIYVSEGGLDLEDGASASVYGRPTDIGDPSATVDNLDIDSYTNLQYHTPSGLLPYGIQVKVGHSPSADNTINSSNAAGLEQTNSQGYIGKTVTGMQIKATPLTGLTLGVSSVQTADGNHVGTASQNTQEAASYAAMVSYAHDSGVKVGWSRAVNEPVIGTLATTAAEEYNQDNYSVAFVTGNLSVSYEIEESTKNTINEATGDIEQKSAAAQAAYTMGGMTMALSYGTFDNVGYDTGKDAHQTLLAVTMAF